jgi:tetratricopeptide (TPR) repeat protein
MSATLTRLRKRAAELEQKKQFDRALEVYVQILDEAGKDLGDEDVPLFNRVGDMLMRKGSVTEALGYYERAVDMYAERGYLNNAIALCSKILRQSPGRAAVYYKLARISAKKGFKSDARKNFLEYADRMQKLGMADEAFRALKEFAALYPDQDDVRLVLAELLSKENRKGEAIEQLQSLYEKLQSEGRAAEARATVDRMRAIDPTVTPRTGTEFQPQPAGADLIFLDLTDTEAPNGRPADLDGPQPASARAPVPTPVPALTGLSITFFPDEEAAGHETPESTMAEPEATESDPVRQPTPVASEPSVRGPSDTPAEDVTETPEPFELVDDGEAPPAEPEFVSMDDQAADGLGPDPALPESRPEVDATHHATPLSGMEFADIELEEAPHVAVARSHDLALPGELPATPGDVAVIPDPSPASDAAADDARAAAEEMADLVADVAAREAAQQTVSSIPDTPATLSDETDRMRSTDAKIHEQPTDFSGRAPANRTIAEIPDDFLANPPSFGVTHVTEEHAFPPLFGLAESAGNPDEPAPAPELEMEADEIESALEPVVPQRYVPTPTRGTISIGTAEGHLTQRHELDPENHGLRRQLGEALLDTGDRDGGLQELELAMVGFELRGDLDRAQEVVDEILEVFPASVAHHQKRVEYAVRSRDRSRLTQSYLELADALFRTGAGGKAIAVYTRVIELDPGNERAEFALSTLAPDELASRRGGSTRPERWTDELLALEADGSIRETVATIPPEETVDSGRNSDGPVPVELVAEAPELSEADKPIDGLELPDPEWGEGAPARSGEQAGIVDESSSGTVADDVEPPPRPSAASEAVEDGVEVAESEEGEDHVDKTGEWEPESTPPDEIPSDLEGADQREHKFVVHAAVDARETTEVADNPPVRSPTPRSIARHTPTPVAKITPRPEIIVGSDADFVDLGEWLRHSEPARSTRMQVESPKPTGDEQADFDELLRRFKRGVAENVEAEDYDAHYDLGVAYKEMGLIDEAIAQFQKALRGPEHRVRSYEALGQCFVEKRQYPIAAALLQRATEVPGSDDQHLVGVLYLLGFATEHMGRPEEALSYYLRVFAVDIEFRDISARVAAMGNLTK